MYEIVRYEPGLKGQVAELQRHLWQGDVALNTAYLEWKYEQNPYLDEPLVYLGVHDGRVVGMRGMFGSRWEIGTPTATFVITAADDFAIAPEHRNRGLFSRIMDAAVGDLASRGHAHALSLSPGPVTLAASLAGGWRVASPMRAARRDSRREAVTRAARARLSRVPFLWRAGAVLPSPPSATHTPFAHLDRPRRPVRPEPGGGVRAESAPRPRAMADLVRRLGHDGRIRHVRDEEYLAWRYRNPLHEYRFLFCERDDLEGYLVLQAYRASPSRGVNVVDWEAATLRARARLLHAAIAWGRFPRLTTWTAGLSGEAATLLRRARFRADADQPLARYVPSVLVRRVGREPDLELAGRSLVDPQNWDMRMVYAMAG